MICPHCDHELTADEVKSLWSSYTNSLVKNRVAGPGRPRTKKYCPCGKMTKDRAKQRNHKCSKPKLKRAA